MLVDSHCHLDFPELAADADGVVARARAAGVGTMVTIGTELARFSGVLAMAERFDNVWCSVGTHPHESGKELVTDPAPLLAHAAHPKVVAIGETGLDYYYEHSPRPPQIESFRAHIAAARTAQLPVIIHTRDADDDTIAVLEDEMGKGTFTGLIHCFTGTKRLAEAALTLGFHISVSGIATFKNSAALREVIETCHWTGFWWKPTRHSWRRYRTGAKPTSPPLWCIPPQCWLNSRATTPEKLAAATTDNFFRLFTKTKRPQ